MFASLTPSRQTAVAERCGGLLVTTPSESFLLFRVAKSRYCLPHLTQVLVYSTAGALRYVDGVWDEWRLRGARASTKCGEARAHGLLCKGSRATRFADVSLRVRARPIAARVATHHHVQCALFI